MNSLDRFLGGAEVRGTFMPSKNKSDSLNELLPKGRSTWHQQTELHPQYKLEDDKEVFLYQKDRFVFAPSKSLTQQWGNVPDGPLVQPSFGNNPTETFLRPPEGLPLTKKQKSLRNYVKEPGMFELLPGDLPPPEPKEFISIDTITQRSIKDQVYSDGVPRQGVAMDLATEVHRNADLSNAVSDLNAILKQGIPQQGGLSPDDFKTLLAQQFQSPGLQGMVFSQEQHKKVAEAEAKARADEVKQLLADGNVSRGKLLEEFRGLQEQGDITNEQLQTLITLTGQLAVEKDDAAKKRILAELQDSFAKATKSKADDRAKSDLARIAQRLQDKFIGLKTNNELDGVKAEMDAKDVISIEEPLTISNPLTWIEVFKSQSANLGKNSVNFKNPADITKSIDALESSNWDKGGVGDVKNRERLALFGILNFINMNRGDLPSYEQIVQIQKLSQKSKYSGFAKGKRSQLFTDFATDVENDIMKKIPSMMTPPPKLVRKTSV